MRTLCLLLCVLFAVPSLANPVEQARGAHQRAGQVHAQALARQQQARAAHEQIVRQIQARKSKAIRNVLGVRDPVLDGLLKQGHDLARTVAEADRAVAAAQARLATERAALLQRLDAALAQTTRAFAQSSGPDKQALFARLQALSVERARLQAAGHQTQQPQTVRLPAIAEGASADELRELADEASDNAERVRKQLAALEQRLSTLTMRRRLLRVERTLDGDLSLFGDDERNRQVARAGRLQAPDGSGRTPPPRAGDDAANAPPEVAPTDGIDAPMAGGDDPQPGAPDPSREFDDTDGDGFGEGVPPVEPPPEAVVPEIAPAGANPGNAVVFEASLDPSLLTEDVDALGPAAVAEQLRALRKKQAQLRKAADELAERRKALEEKADTLDNE